jgi:hypothetical protein
MSGEVSSLLVVVFPRLVSFHRRWSGFPSVCVSLFLSLSLSLSHSLSVARSLSLSLSLCARARARGCACVCMRARAAHARSWMFACLRCDHVTKTFDDAETEYMETIGTGH